MDGAVGAVTVAALNVPADIRVRQIATNMERWRMLPQELGQRYIAVNIPNFALEVVENGQPVLPMKVVVGKMMEKQNTPIFSAFMTHLVLNPYWYVPKSIAEKELFPLSRKDPQYFAKHNFQVRRVVVGEKQLPDQNAFGGATMTTKVYEYRLRQGPGPKNSLGRVKFMFPNSHGVYLHDTPSKELFNRTVRTFSHGCIRVEKPLDLAEYILRDTARWTRQAILATLEQQKEQTVWLPEPIPVYIQYWTASVDPDGIEQFRSDIYEYDRLPGTRLPTSKPSPPPVEVQPKPQPPLPLEVPPATQAGAAVTTPPPEAPPAL
jgi:murein L,D-transpeptidase YcbB/YkuD